MATSTNDFKKGKSTFTLVGKLKLSPNSFTIDKVSEETGFVSNRVYLGVDCGNGNVVYAQMFDGYNDNKRLFVHGVKLDPNGNKTDDFSSRFEVEWKDRFNDDVIEETGPQCFIKIGLDRASDGKLRIARYLSAYDAINHMYEVFKDMPQEKKDDITVRVMGNIEYSYYNDKVNVKKNITSVYLSEVEPQNFKSEFIQTVYVDKASIGKANPEMKTLPLTVTIPEYVGKYNGIKIGQTVPLEYEMLLDCSTEMTANTSKYIATEIKSSTGFSRAIFKGTFKESGATEEIDLSKLAPNVRRALEAGAISEDDVRMIVAQGTSRVQLMYITGFHVTKNEVEDGDTSPVESTISYGFEPNVYTTKEMLSLKSDFLKKIEETGNVEEPKTEVSHPAEEEFDPFSEDNSSEPDLNWMNDFT